MTPRKPREFEPDLRRVPLRDTGLEIKNTRLEPLVQRLEAELQHAGIRRLRPHFYLSTEWGVPFGTRAIGVPFYLAHPELVALHAQRVGHVEGFNESDILRYFRHEMGHVVNYAYRLYEEEAWVKQFGSITQPYVEDYRPRPFSTQFVQHLPGWYAQKHPDEDWSETFAVWMTPDFPWREHYAHWPGALAKLEYCDDRMRELGDAEPLVTDIEADDDVRDLAFSIEEYYRTEYAEEAPLPPGIDGAIRAIFEDIGAPTDSHPDVARKSAAELVRQLEPSLLAEIYRWTGHFPERTRPIVRQLAQRAEELGQVYPVDRELTLAVAITALVGSLAANYVHYGSYLGPPDGGAVS